MADGGTGEKTEEPTPERLRKLREEGNVPKSQDVNQAFAFLGVFMTIALTMPFIGKNIVGLMHDAAYVAFALTEYDAHATTRIMAQATWTMLKVCAPALGAAFVLGTGLNVAQVGLMFTTKPLTPDVKKINPVNGFKNLFNQKKLVELVKTILKFVIVSFFSYVALESALGDVVNIMRSDLEVGMKVIGKIIFDFCWKIGIVFIAISMFDALYQHRRFMHENKMSKYDVKQEFKQSEGDPQLKAERRRLHQELLNSAGSVQGGSVTMTDKMG